jgi:hypothetical protein
LQIIFTPMTGFGGPGANTAYGTAATLNAVEQRSLIGGSGTKALQPIGGGSFDLSHRS